MGALHRLILSCSSLCLAFMSTAVLAADPTADPCALLSKAEIEQVIGKLKSTGRPSQFERVRTCDWEFVNDASGLSLWLFPAEGMERARKQYKDLIAVKGLGEEAFIHHNLRLGRTEIYVKKGNAMFEVSVPEGEGDEAKVQALARKAVARL
jgi:hypothetical protein